MLSGNRNFEARIHPNLKANFLASPPLVVAFAIAGTVLKDLTTEPLGNGKDGKPVYLSDIWPTSHEIAAVIAATRAIPTTFRRSTAISPNANPMWKEIAGATGPGLRLAEVDLHREAAVLRRLHDAAGRDRPTSRGARALGIFGDSVTTDHISPAGSIKPTSPAGQ